MLCGRTLRAPGGFVALEEVAAAEGFGRAVRCKACFRRRPTAAALSLLVRAGGKAAAACRGPPVFERLTRAGGVAFRATGLGADLGAERVTDGAERGAAGVGRLALGAGRDAAGCGRLARGAGRDAAGFGRLALGAARDGAGRLARGAGRDAAGCGRLARGAGRDAAGLGRGERDADRLGERAARGAGARFRWALAPDRPLDPLGRWAEASGPAKMTIPRSKTPTIT